MLGLNKKSAATTSPVPDLATTPGLAIGVLGAKGGVGATTFALNLGATLARLGRDCVLVDTHLQQPDLACLLNIKPRVSLDDLCLRQGQITSALLDTCVTRDPQLLDGRLGLVSPSLELSRSLSTDVDDVTSLICELKTLNQASASAQLDYVVDLQRHMDSHLITLMDDLDHIYLVIEATVPCLAAAGRWFTILKDLGLDASKLTVILNRAFGKVKDVEKHIQGALQGYPLVKVNNAYEAAEAAAVEGIPLVVREPRSAYARDLTAIARLSLSARK